MPDETTRNEWVSLSNGFDVELQHGIPLRLSNNGLDIPADDAMLAIETVDDDVTIVSTGFSPRLAVDRLLPQDFTCRKVDRRHAAASAGQNRIADAQQHKHPAHVGSPVRIR